MTFPHLRTLSHDGLRQRELTTSYRAIMDHAERDELIDEVSKVVDQLAEPIELSYLTTCHGAKVESVPRLKT